MSRVYHADYLQADQVACELFGQLVQLVIADGLAAYHADLFRDAETIIKYITPGNLALLSTFPNERIEGLFRARYTTCGTDFVLLTFADQNTRDWWTASDTGENAKMPKYAFVINAYESTIGSEDGKPYKRDDRFELTIERIEATSTSKPREVQECSHNPGTGEIYYCHGLDCPVHGERNRELVKNDIADLSRYNVNPNSPREGGN